MQVTLCATKKKKKSGVTVSLWDLNPGPGEGLGYHLCLALLWDDLWCLVSRTSWCPPLELPWICI